jgi:UDP-GlcNAc3NAcA epimerase
VGALARAIDRRQTPGDSCEHFLIHTGQHYDANMSADFFDLLGLPQPTANLQVGSNSSAAQVGEMTHKLDSVLRGLEPDVVAVFGDTNSTLAGGLAASKLGIPVAHVESGLRSFNLSMPEELNRRLVDNLATYLFCPSRSAVANLASEGIVQGVHLTGDVMYESMRHTLSLATDTEGPLDRLGLEPGGYVFVTSHRAENTDHPERLAQILGGVSEVAAAGVKVVFPVHPRTRSLMQPHLTHPDLHFLDPLDHLTTLLLVESARCALTDSGGLQKETYWLGTPCVTMRDETEWVETIESGWNVLAGADRRRIASSAEKMMAGPLPPRVPLYGEGTQVSSKILDVLMGRIADAAAS